MKKHILIPLALIALGSIGGCSLVPSQKPIDTTRIKEVVNDVKRQVSIYVSDQNKNYNRDGSFKSTHRAECGNKMIDYDITQVKLELLTTYVSKTSGGVSVSAIPVPIPILVGGGLNFGVQNTNSQELVFISKPRQDKKFRYDGADGMNAPLADVMRSLKQSLKDAGDIKNRICMETIRSESNEGNSFKIAIEVEEDLSGNISVGLAPLMPLGLTASQDMKSTTGNTITFTFQPHDFKTPEFGVFKTPDSGVYFDQGKIGKQKAKKRTGSQVNIFKDTPKSPVKAIKSVNKECKLTGRNCLPDDLDGGNTYINTAPQQ